MINILFNKGPKGYIVTIIIFLLGALLVWAGVKSIGFLGICVGSVILLISVAMFMFISLIPSQKDVIKVIKRDFPPEFHEQLIALYEPFRKRERDALFIDILKKAKKDFHQVERFSEIAARVDYHPRGFFDEVGID